MLRPAVNDEPPADTQEEAPCWRVSSGSAAVLGLSELRMDAAPTTAYLMLGERCRRNCAFCTQARESQAHAAALSRVIWPDFPAPAVAEAIARAYREGRIARACFQVTVSPQHLARTREAVRTLARRSAVPICTSVAPRNLDDVAELLAAGAERVTIALDAACERVYRQVKTGSWTETVDLLTQAAQHFPGHVGTHLIVGLGETEREMAERIQWATDLGVTVALFAFTPVPGTALAQLKPPELAVYRRMQAARWLIVQGLTRAECFAYDSHAYLCGYGLDEQALRALLADGAAFRTSGCPGCNRPYYNERPGGVLYNYPRPLTSGEAAAEVDALLETLLHAESP